MNTLVKHAGLRTAVFLLFAVLVSSGTAFAKLTATANHDRISVDFFYHGSTVSVRGVSDPGTDLVVKIASPEGEQVLRQKGKVGGLLWMNVGKLTFERVPTLYFVQSTKNLSDMLSEEEMNKHVLGYPALEKHSEVSPVASVAEKEKWFDEFVSFKEASKLYSTASGKISTTQEGGEQQYYILLDWPYQAPPGEYTVSVYAVKDNKVVDSADTKVHVEQVGIVKSLAGMAKNKAAAYGLISILVALGAGFGVGLVFRKGGGAH
ncbi:MAG: TIGR02186 family protein [Nitrospiraceae bacterium]|nr:TIGR02186 family protein [Nitrospiraceae bacterium]